MVSVLASPFQTIIALPVTNPNWEVFAVGDFDGDGYFDIVWKRQDGTLLAFLMGPNGSIKSIINDAGIAPNGYAVVQP